jgi:hypothetical protein
MKTIYFVISGYIERLFITYVHVYPYAFGIL